MERASFPGDEARNITRRRHAHRYNDLKNYYWFFGMMHVKAFLTIVMLFLCWTSMKLLLHTATQPYIHIEIPGLDGKSVWTEEIKPTHKPFHNEFEKLFTKEVRVPEHKESVINNETSEFYRDVLNIWSYFCLGSVILAAIGAKVSERNHKRTFLRKIFNPALLMMPLMIVLLSLVYPLGAWSIRSYHTETYECRYTRRYIADCNTIIFWLHFIRLIALPVFLVWTCFVYVYFGCCVALLFIWHSANGNDNNVNNFLSSQDPLPLIRETLECHSLRETRIYESLDSIRETTYPSRINFDFYSPRMSSFPLSEHQEKRVDMELGRNTPAMNHCPF